MKMRWWLPTAALLFGACNGSISGSGKGPAAGGGAGTGAVTGAAGSSTQRMVASLPKCRAMRPAKRTSSLPGSPNATQMSVFFGAIAPDGTSRR